MPKLNQSASRWRKADLDFLGVDYDYENIEDIHIPNVGMPTELAAGKKKKEKNILRGTDL